MPPLQEGIYQYVFGHGQDLIKGSFRLGQTTSRKICVSIVTNCETAVVGNILISLCHADELSDLQTSCGLQSQNDPYSDYVSHGSAGKGVSGSESSGVTSLEARVSIHELQSSGRLPVGGRCKAEPTGEQHQSGRCNHDLHIHQTRSKSLLRQLVKSPTLF